MCGTLEDMQEAAEEEPDLVLIEDDYGSTALARACGSFESPLEKVRWILDRGTDLLDEADDTNRTPLHHASHEGNSSVVKLLLEMGADPTIGRDGELPLDVAKNKECKQLLKVSLLPFLGVLVQSDTD
jgi:ankyrin repeat protein